MLVIISFPRVRVNQNQVIKTDLWNNLSAVKNNHVIEVQAETYWYNDPYTLEYMRKDLKEKFLKRIHNLLFTVVF